VLIVMRCTACSGAGAERVRDEHVEMMKERRAASDVEVESIT
jgi:hypothetical protein